MTRKSILRWAFVLGAACGGLLKGSSALAQGCAMCYNDAAAQSAAGIKALQHGIVVLLIPALVLFSAVFVAAWRRREPVEIEMPKRAAADSSSHRNG